MANKTVAVAYDSRGRILWRTSLRGIQPLEWVEGVSWSGDGSMVAVATDTGVIVLNASSGGLLWQASGLGASHPTWAPGSGLLAVLSASGLHVFEARTGRQLWWLPARLDGYSWSPRGDLLVVNTGAPTVLGPTCSVEATLPIHGQADAVAWSPKGLIAATWPGGVMVYGGAGSLLWERSLGGLAGPLAWSPDGSRLAVEASGYLYMLTASGEMLWRHESPGGQALIAWSPDGRYVALLPGEAGGLVVVNASTGEPLPLPLLPFMTPRHAAWSPRAPMLLAWDSRSIAIAAPGPMGLKARVIRGPGSPGWVEAAAWSPSGQLVAALVDDGSSLNLTIYNATGSTLLNTRLPLRPGQPVLEAWSPEGSVIALAVKDSLYLLAPDGTILYNTTLPGPARSLAWSPNASLLAVATPDKLTIYKIKGLPVTGHLTVNAEPGTHLEVAGPGGRASYTIGPTGHLDLWATPGPYTVKAQTPQGTKVQYKLTIKPWSTTRLNLTPQTATPTKTETITWITSQATQATPTQTPPTTARPIHTPANTSQTTTKTQTPTSPTRHNNKKTAITAAAITIAVAIAALAAIQTKRH
ncbi:MAG: PQQ-binding-like beta-propeller repeat protein [Desulfurococcales archaeon]|nr:PQQ-binding-like beta-propeller repeat protein [Desulfurococcales archaeon]